MSDDRCHDGTNLLRAHFLPQMPPPFHPATMEQLTLPRFWKRTTQRALHDAVAAARLVMITVCAGFEQGGSAIARKVAELVRALEQTAITNEMNAILRARLAAIPPQLRPHYTPQQRLAILILRARAGWNAAQTAAQCLVTPQTVSAWMRRLDERSEEEFLQTPSPVNKYPDFVALVAQQLRATIPAAGRRRLADTFARLGLHIAASTAERLLKKPTRRPTTTPPTAAPAPKTPATPATKVTASHPHQLWHVDVTVVPTSGSWVPWWPFALATCWPFYWHLAAVVDHFSRAVVAARLFKNNPSAKAMSAFLSHAVQLAGIAPTHLVTDQGVAFKGAFQSWCIRNSVQHRYGAIGKHGSIAVIERFFRSLKQEFLRRIIIPLSPQRMMHAVSAYATWFNIQRPHQTHRGRTPADVLFGDHTAAQAIEPRAKYPIPLDDIGKPKRVRVKDLTLSVAYHDGNRLLPVLQLHHTPA